MPVVTARNSWVRAQVAVRDGRVAVVSTAGDRQTITLQLCADPACRRPGRKVVDPTLGISRTGLPVVVAATGSDLRLYTCTDRLCRAPTGHLVSAAAPGIAELAVAEASDGSVHVAWLAGEAMVLFRCARSPCG